MKDIPASNVMRRLWPRLLSPAVAFMNRLSYAEKIGVISLLFLVPTGWVTAQFVDEINDRIDFAASELRGVAYLRPVRTLLEDVTSSRRLSGQNAARVARENQQTLIERDFDALLEADRRSGNAFHTADILATVRGRWSELREKGLPAADDESLRLHTELIGSLRELMKHVGDQSKLILDPDLDSYYLMDAVLLKLPERLTRLAEHQLFMRKAVADGQIDAREKAELIRFVAFLESSLRESERGMRIAFGTHGSSQLESRLQPDIRADTGMILPLMESLRTMSAGDSAEPLGDADEQRIEGTVQSSFRLWDRTAEELERLLQARSARFVHKRRVVLAVLAASLIVVAWLWLGFYASVLKTVETLTGTTRRLVEGDFSTLPTVATQDELLTIGVSFGAIAVRLRDECRQAHEDAERTRIAEAALRASEERFQLAVRGSTDGLWDWEMPSDSVYYSPRFKELIGFEDHEFENQLSAWQHRLHPDDLPGVMAAIQAHLRDRVPYDVRYRLRLKSGDYRWFRARGQAVWNSAGQAIRMAGSITDITDQHTAEAALQWEQFLLHTLLEHLPDCIYFKDTEGRFLRASRSLAVKCGRERPDELVGRTDAEFFPAEYAAQAREDELELIRSGLPLIEKEERPHWATGTDTWVATTKVPLRSEQGTLLGTFGISHDITAHKEAETRFRRVVDAAPNPLVVVDGDGEIQLVNAAAETLFDYTRAELIGQPIELLVPERFEASHQISRREYFEEPTARVMGMGRELTGRRRDGTEIPVEVGLSPLRFGDETVVLSSVHDITLRKQAEQTLIRARDVAESANRAKSDFLANMSHEIRTPMNAVIGMTELLLDSPLTAPQRDYLNTVLESAESLMGIINEILDFSKIEAGHLELGSVELDLGELIPDTLRSLAPRAHRKGLELIWRIHPGGPSRVRGDPQRIRQILVNLVGNAIKFTERGEIEVDVRSESEGTNAVSLHCEIRDTGIGIPQNRAEAIFHPFEQVDNTTTRRYGGTGLGLSISSRLVDAMGGRIKVASQLGVGSTFSFVLRLGMVHGEPGETQAPSWPDLAGIHILIVDDNATNLRVLQEMLEARGMRVASVESVDRAVAWLADAAERGLQVPLMLSDVNMPERDGYELAGLVRAWNEWRNMAIILLTSGSRAGDTARAESLQISACLMKPIKQSELFAAISRAVGKQTVKSSPPQRSAEAANQLAAEMSPLRILLAEDGLANQKLAVGLLTRWGHSVSVARDGREAVRRLQAESFDLVLMDVNMPEMDGFEATREIRRGEAGTGRHIPIVAMTAHALKGDRERCLECGMDGYVAKPIRREELLKALAPLCRHLTSGEKPFEEIVLPVVDWERILQGLEGDRELLCSVLEACLEESPGFNVRLKQGVADGDGTAVARAAHAIKGTLRILEIGSVASLLESIESWGKSGELEKVALSLERWMSMWNALRTQIEAFVRKPEGVGA